MLGWGLYKIRIGFAQPSDTLDAVEFYINTTDGNWGLEGVEMDFNFWVYPGFSAPTIKIYNYSAAAWQTVTYGATINSWDILLPSRNRDNLRAGYDYSASDTATVPFVLIDNANYPREVEDYGIKIVDATLDVNTRLEADTINVPNNRTFRIADWYSPSYTFETTTALADAGTWIHVGGNLYLEGHGSAYDDITVFLTGMSQQRGYWRGIELSDGAYLNSDHAAIEYPVRGVLLTGGTSADITNSLIREFSRHGIYQSNNTVVVARNSVIRDGSIGVYATGDCGGSIYGWSDLETTEPVWVYDNDGHGFELENLVDTWYLGKADQASTFCIQHAQIYENGLYGVWHHGEGSPLIQENEINFNGLYGGGTPSHDGVHVNGGSWLSVHKNNIKGNAYGIHHVDAGDIYGRVHPTTTPDGVQLDKVMVGYNCIRENTYNLGGGRGATTHLGFGETGTYENDGAAIKWDGSNSFIDPTGFTQVTLNNNTVYLEHNYWHPYFNYTGTGTIITNGDFAASSHDLPCIVGNAPGAGAAAGELALSNLSADIRDINAAVDLGAWAQVRTLACNVLASGPSRLEADVAANSLLQAYAASKDTSIILALTNIRSTLLAASVLNGNALSRTLFALRGMYMMAGNAMLALSACDALISNFTGREEAFSGKLYKSFIYAGMLGDDVNALAVVNDMLRATPNDPEALAQYYSITHTFPRQTPKKNIFDREPEIELAQNYPNPFNPSTTISIRVPSQSPVSLKVFDAHGKLLRTLHEGTLSAGSHVFTFNAENLPSGLYRCVLTSDGARTVRNMVYIK
jgi:hypothetical protein